MGIDEFSCCGMDLHNQCKASQTLDCCLTCGENSECYISHDVPAEGFSPSTTYTFTINTNVVGGLGFVWQVPEAFGNNLVRNSNTAKLTTKTLSWTSPADHATKTFRAYALCGSSHNTQTKWIDTCNILEASECSVSGTARCHANGCKPNPSGPSACLPCGKVYVANPRTIHAKETCGSSQITCSSTQLSKPTETVCVDCENNGNECCEDWIECNVGNQWESVAPSATKQRECTDCNVLSCLSDKYLSTSCGGSSDGVCTPRTITCPSRQYLKGGSATSDAVCTVCDASCSSGSHITSTACGGTSNSVTCKDCTQHCGPGKFLSGVACNGKGIQDTTTCETCTKSCPAGKYLDTASCDGSGTSDTSVCRACVDCPVGHYKGIHVLNECHQCTSCTNQCNAGEYLDGGACDGTSLSDTKTCETCTKCPTGTFKTGTCAATSDTTVCTSCLTQCPLNTYVTQGGITQCVGTETSDPNSCTPCKTCGTDESEEQPCDGTGAKDSVTCTSCSTSCQVGQYIKSTCGSNGGVRCGECTLFLCGENLYRQECDGTGNRMDGGHCLACHDCSTDKINGVATKFNAGVQCSGVENHDTTVCSFKQCSCSHAHGSAAEKEQCPTNGADYCGSCQEEYYWKDGTCVAWSKECDPVTEQESVAPSNAVDRKCEPSESNNDGKEESNTDGKEGSQDADPGNGDASNDSSNSNIN